MNPYAQFPFIGRASNVNRQGTVTGAHETSDQWVSQLAYRAIDLLWDAGHRLATALRAHSKRRRAIDQLSALDDGTLKDIGLHRSEIRSAVEEVLVQEAAHQADTTTGAPERIVRFAQRNRRKPAIELPARAAA